MAAKLVWNLKPSETNNKNWVAWGFNRFHKKRSEHHGCKSWYVIEAATNSKPHWNNLTELEAHLSCTQFQGSIRSCYQTNPKPIFGPTNQFYYVDHECEGRKDIRTKSGALYKFAGCL